jgi:hypothetical protein
MLSGVFAIGRQIHDSPRRAGYGNATNAACYVIALTNVPGATANVLHDDCEHRLGPFQTRNIDNDGPRKRPRQSNASPPIIAYLNCPLRASEFQQFPAGPSSRLDHRCNLRKPPKPRCQHQAHAQRLRHEERTECRKRNRGIDLAERCHLAAQTVKPNSMPKQQELVMSCKWEMYDARRVLARRMPLASSARALAGETVAALAVRCPTVPTPRE